MDSRAAWQSDTNSSSTCYGRNHALMEVIAFWAIISLFARHGRALTGASPEHAQVVGNV